MSNSHCPINREELPAASPNMKDLDLIASIRRRSVVPGDPYDQAAKLIARLVSDIDKFWFLVEHSYDIEPRAFFEKDARENGFDSPLAQAAHHMWKRDPAVAKAIADEREACIRVLENMMIGGRAWNVEQALAADVLSAGIKALQART